MIFDLKIVSLLGFTGSPQASSGREGHFFDLTGWGIWG
jgi:hypothetical protein